MTTTEAAAQIRKTLKAHGWTSRDVSVRSDLYSMGSTIRVLVKSPAVDMATVRDIAEKFSRVSRCEATGEILNGGNRFVEIDWARPVVEAISAGLLENIREDGTVSEPLPGVRVFRTNDTSGHYYAAWHGGDEIIHCWGREFCARQLAVMVLEGKLSQDATPAPVVEDPQCWIISAEFLGKAAA